MANEVVATRTVVPAVTAPPAPTPLDTAPAVSAEPLPQGDGFIAHNWRWLVPLVSVPLLAWAWLWYVRRRDFDEAGLPRGPRL